MEIVKRFNVVVSISTLLFFTTLRATTQESFLFKLHSDTVWHHTAGGEVWKLSEKQTWSYTLAPAGNHLTPTHIQSAAALEFLDVFDGLEWVLSQDDKPKKKSSQDELLSHSDEFHKAKLNGGGQTERQTAAESVHISPTPPCCCSLQICITSRCECVCTQRIRVCVCVFSFCVMNNQASFYCFFILVDLFMNGDTHIFCVRVLRSCGPLQVIHIYTNCSDIPSALSWTRRGGAAAIKMLTTRRLKTAHVRASPKRLCDILHTAAVIKLAACLERPVSSKVEVGNCSNWLGVPPRCVRGGCSSPRQRIMTGWDGERERERGNQA